MVYMYMYMYETRLKGNSRIKNIGMGGGGRNL